MQIWSQKHFAVILKLFSKKKNPFCLWELFLEYGIYLLFFTPLLNIFTLRRVNAVPRARAKKIPLKLDTQFDIYCACVTQHHNFRIIWKINPHTQTFLTWACTKCITDAHGKKWWWYCFHLTVHTSDAFAAQNFKVKFELYAHDA